MATYSTYDDRATGVRRGYGGGAGLARPGR